MAADPGHGQRGKRDHNRAQRRENARVHVVVGQPCNKRRQVPDGAPPPAERTNASATTDRGPLA